MVELPQLSWDNLLLLVLVLGLPVILGVMLRPRLFWPLLIIVNILGNGPKVMGYVILDEIFTGCIVIGALLRINMTRAHRHNNKSNQLQRVPYLWWAGYLILQSFVGIVVNEDLRLVRFLLLFLLLAVLWRILYFKGDEFPFPSSRGVSLIVTVTTIVYFVAYLGQGLGFESAYGTYGKFLSQDYFWSGSAIAVLPILIGVPAAVSLITDHSIKSRALAWVSIALMMGVAFYFDSRVSWLVIFALCAISWRRLKVSRLLGISFLFVGLAFFLLGDIRTRVPNLIGELVGTSQALWSAQENDLRSRALLIKASVNTVLANPKALFFGEGIYSHRYLIVPYVRELLAQFPGRGDFASLAPRGNDEVEIIRTTGFPALLIDTGLLGIILFAVNVAFVLGSVLKARTPIRILMFVVLIMAILWLFVANTLDAVLWYLLLMPGGMIQKWSRNYLSIDGQSHCIREEEKKYYKLDGRRKR